MDGLSKVMNLYRSRGLHVQQINADNEFECVREEIQPFMLNTSASDKHVNTMERSIQTIKDRTR